MAPESGSLKIGSPLRWVKSFWEEFKYYLMLGIKSTNHRPFILRKITTTTHYELGQLHVFQYYAL